MQQFVAAKLTGRSLNATEARLRVAVANTGGGKRAMLHSMGKEGGEGRMDWRKVMDHREE